jgi:type VI secretion system protein ImpE
MTATLASDDAEATLRLGDTSAALQQLQAQVRAQPADARLRTFLFQLLSVRGDWQRALEQLTLAAQLDPKALLMAQTYREALRCEALRARVVAGQTSPMVVGEPDPWLGLLVESLLRAGMGDQAASRALRARAFEQAPASSGTIDGQRFEWIADADVRFGPVLEAVLNGGYYWIPFGRLQKIALAPPEDLRDLVWAPAQLQFANGGEAAALVPSRYPGTETSADGALQMGRRTAWTEVSEDVQHGLGQRLLATDVAEYPLLEVREIIIDQAS